MCVFTGSSNQLCILIGLEQLSTNALIGRERNFPGIQKYEGSDNGWNLVHSTQKSTEIKPEIKKSKISEFWLRIQKSLKTALLLSPQSIWQRSPTEKSTNIKVFFTWEVEMSTLNQSVTVWQLYIMFLRVVGPTSSSRNLPVQKYILFSPKIKAIAFEELILSGNIHREYSDWKSQVSIAFHYCFTEKCCPRLYKRHFKLRFEKLTIPWSEASLTL
jgi:hypothetical protein